MSEIITKEVRFDEYCKRCQYEDKKESDDPCWDCLENPVNYNSHKPVRFKEKETLNAKKGTKSSKKVR